MYPVKRHSKLPWILYMIWYNSYLYLTLLIFNLNMFRLPDLDLDECTDNNPYRLRWCWIPHQSVEIRNQFV